MRKHTGTDLFGLRCEVCQSYLIQTPGGLLTCPAGHGRLQVGRLEEVGDRRGELDSDEACGSWFSGSHERGE